jgi:DNA-binding NarL/FixJ family response regulator
MILPSGAAIVIMSGQDEGADEESGESRPSAAATQMRERPAGRPRILIVEDDFLVGMEIEAGLAEAGHDVIGIAVSAEEAVMLAEAEKPVLAVMDIRLAGARDGVDAALEIHRRFGIRSVFASAHGDADIRARAAEACPAGWIDKPYRLPTLLAAVRRALASLDDAPPADPAPQPEP